MEVRQSDFGNGTNLFSMVNDNGVRLDVSDFGARIVNLVVPTDTGERNIVLGFESSEDYMTQDSYIGATIGRVAGRINSGRFKLDGKTYQVQTNTEAGHTLHGGAPSFEGKIWQSQIIRTEGEVSVMFTLTSPDGENGFPGNLTTSVTYSLNNQNEWTLVYQAQTDQTTLYNPTNHVYFNLTGDVETPIDGHELTVMADQFAVLNSDGTVTGEKRDVSGTSFDFRTAKSLKDCFELANDAQKDLFSGIDHPFFLSHEKGADVILQSPDGKVSVEVETDQETIVIFTANFGQNKMDMRGKTLGHHGGITFETQAAPGAIEFEDFGDIVLCPDQFYHAKTTYLLKF